MVLDPASVILPSNQKTLARVSNREALLFFFMVASSRGLCIFGEPLQSLMTPAFRRALGLWLTLAVLAKERER